jgi:hypothetical protein
MGNMWKAQIAGALFGAALVALIAVPSGASPVATLSSDVKFVTAQCDWGQAVSVDRLPADCDTQTAPVATILIFVSGTDGAWPVNLFAEKVHVIWSEPGTAEAQREEPMWTFQTVPSVKPNTVYRIKARLCTYVGPFSPDDCGAWTPYISVRTPPAPAAPSTRPAYGIAAPVSLRLVADPNECRAIAAPAPCPAAAGGVLFQWQPGVIGCIAQRCGHAWGYELAGLGTVRRLANGAVAYVFPAPSNLPTNRVLANTANESGVRYCASVRAFGESDYRSAPSNTVCFRRRDYVAAVKRAIALQGTVAPRLGPAANHRVAAPHSAPAPTSRH